MLSEVVEILSMVLEPGLAVVSLSSRASLFADRARHRLVLSTTSYPGRREEPTTTLRTYSHYASGVTTGSGRRREHSGQHRLV